MVKPGPGSASKMLMPECRGSAAGSVLQSRAITPECLALVIQVLLPLTTYSSPSRVATVRIAWRSDPPPGSVSAIVARISPVAIFGAAARAARRYRTYG